MQKGVNPPARALFVDIVERICRVLSLRGTKGCISTSILLKHGDAIGLLVIVSLFKIPLNLTIYQRRKTWIKESQKVKVCRKIVFAKRKHPADIVGN